MASNSLYTFVQDQDRHWYRIKSSDEDVFNELCEQAYDNEEFEEFYDKFLDSLICCNPKNYSEYYNEDGTRK